MRLLNTGPHAGLSQHEQTPALLQTSVLWSLVRLSKAWGRHSCQCHTPHRAQPSSRLKSAQAAGHGFSSIAGTHPQTTRLGLSSPPQGLPREPSHFCLTCTGKRMEAEAQDQQMLVLYHWSIWLRIKYRFGIQAAKKLWARPGQSYQGMLK